MRGYILLFVFYFIFSNNSYSQKTNVAIIQPTDTEAEIKFKAANIVPTPRQLRWQQLELTAFFHFGINTFTNREWGDGKEDVKLFNPISLDAKQWVSSCKEAGIKQVIITAKHHDGFCLWPSKFTEHSVKNSPWKNGMGDVVKEVKEACKELNIGFGIYLSPWDRNNSTYGTEAYNEYFINQLTELLTGYGQVDEVWFDGANGEGANGKKQVYDFDRWYKLIRTLQPQATIAIMGPDVRWVGTESGHGRETEWSVVPANNLNQMEVSANSQQDLSFKPQGDMMGNDLGSWNKIKNAKGLVWYPAETDVSIRPGWFYHESEDLKVKTGEELTQIYMHSVGRNSVLLLNIPPDKNGLLTHYDIAALKAWRKSLDEIFAVNLFTNAKQKTNIKSIKSLLDKNDSTGISFSMTKKNNSVEVVFKNTQTFNVFMLQEIIRTGQRIEKFILEYWQDNKWEIVAEGTTVGYKRILAFPTVSSKKIRLRLLASRLEPELAEIGLFFSKIK